MSLNTQGSRPTPCWVDGDCPTSLVCIRNTTSWTHGESYCICSPWYAWQLETPTSTTCVLTGSTIASVALFAVSAAIIIWLLVILVVTIRDARTIKSIRRDTGFILIFIFTFGWLITGLIRVVLTGLEFALPNDQTLMPYGPSWKYSPYDFYAKPLFVIVLVFGMITDFQLVIVWLSVSGAADRSARKRSIRYFQLLVWSIQASYIIGGSFMVLQEYNTEFLYFSIAYFVFNVVGYALAGCHLHSLLSKALAVDTGRSNDHMNYVARRIRWIALTNSALIMCQIISILGISATNADFCEIGFVAAGFHDAQVSVMVCQLIAVTLYLSNTITSRKRYEAEQQSTNKTFRQDRTDRQINSLASLRLAASRHFRLKNVKLNPVRKFALPMSSTLARGNAHIQDGSSENAVSPTPPAQSPKTCDARASNELRESQQGTRVDAGSSGLLPAGEDNPETLADHPTSKEDAFDPDTWRFLDQVHPASAANLERLKALANISSFDDYALMDIPPLNDVGLSSHQEEST